MTRASPTASDLLTSRREAAGILRQARQRLDAGLDAGDVCGWAMTLLPESRAAQRVTIDWLLRSGQVEHALTLTSGALLRRRGDAGIWFRRARALVLANRADDARSAIDRALALRPHHRPSMLLAAEIAQHQNEGEREIELLERARLARRDDDAATIRLIEALLRRTGGGQATALARAESLLQQVACLRVDLAARILARRGQLLDARLELEAALEFTNDADERHRLLLALVSVLQQAGNWAELRRLAERYLESVSPAAGSAQGVRVAAAIACDVELAVSLASALLAVGAFAAAAQALDACGSPNHPEILAVRTILAAAADDRVAALESLGRLRAASGSPAQQSAGQPSRWLRSLMGLVVREQTDVAHARRAGADPMASVLDHLLPKAHATLEAAAVDQPATRESRRWQALADLCHSAQVHAQAARPAQTAEFRSEHAARVRQAA